MKKIVSNGRWQCWGCENNMSQYESPECKVVCEVMLEVIVPCHYFKNEKCRLQEVGYETTNL
jgi:hypothetical protein